MNLYGSKRFNLDAKARLTLPANFRKEFDGNQLLLIPLKDALHGYTPDGYAQWVDSFFEMNGKKFEPANPKHTGLKLKLMGNAVPVDIDSAGRVALGKVDATRPGERERLGLTREVTVVGVGDHFEVWNAKKWEDYNANLVDDLEALMTGGVL